MTHTHTHVMANTLLSPRELLMSTASSFDKGHCYKWCYAIRSRGRYCRWFGVIASVAIVIISHVFD